MSKEKSNESEKKSSFWSNLGRAIFAGGLGGAVEVLVDHPFWRLKTRYQDPTIPNDKKFTLDRKELYKGLKPNMASMIPITAIQVGGSALVEGVLQTDEKTQLSDKQKLLAAGMGGAMSAIVSGPVELIMSHQTPKRDFLTTAYDLVRQHGNRILTRGMIGTAFRDAVFTDGYRFGKPFLKKKWEGKMSENTAKVSAAVGSGLIAAVVSHPADTIKTIQQTSINSEKGSPSSWEVASDVFQKEGFKGFYKGFMFRTMRVISAVTLIGSVTEAVENKFKNR